LREAVDFLREQAVENDPATEGKRGVNIVIPPSLAVQRVVATPAAASPAPAGVGNAAGVPPAGTPIVGAPPVGAPPAAATRPVTAPVAPPAERGNITIELNQIPLGEALRYIANQAGLKVKIEPYAVSLVPKTEMSNDLLVKRYHVPPEFFGGPMDVGYYITDQATTAQAAAAGAESSPPP